ncbi:MAG TPA: hypothetical protein VK957_06395 [Lunatimonas sp.]|nr:hypothetical protein [Lunatimonas sp.]
MKKLHPIFLFLLFFSCNEDTELISEPEPIAFERVQPNLSGHRGNVGNLAVYHDRLYYSNVQNPGYFTTSGGHTQFDMNTYNMDMGQAIDEHFLIGPLRDLKTLVFNPTQNFSSTFANRLNITTIPGVPEDAILALGNMFKLNFGLNENHFLFTYQSSTGTKALIVELNIVETPNVARVLMNPAQGQQVLNVTPINFQIDVSNNNHIEVGRVFPYKEGWVASTWISSLAVPLYISKDGSAKVIPQGHDIMEKRISFISLEHSPSGELFATTETELFYSQTGNVEDLTPIAQSNQWMRIRFIGDRLVCFVGMDIIYEIINYKDSETIDLRLLENKGLEDLLIRDIELFNGKVYLATNAGLFTKLLEDFWEEKMVPSGGTMGLPIERLK